MEHRENLAVLRDPGGESPGIQNNGLDVLDHTVLAEPQGPVSPKILV
ncbi:hypothetical protein [Nonomuraea sp. NPDC049141]